MDFTASLTLNNIEAKNSPLFKDGQDVYSVPYDTVIKYAHGPTCF